MAAHHLPQNIYYLNKTIYNLYRICYPVSWHKNRITKVFHCPNVAIFAIKTRMIVSAVICYIDRDSIVSSTHDILVWSNVLCPITLMWTLISWCVLLIPILVVSWFHSERFASFTTFAWLADTVRIHSLDYFCANSTDSFC